MYLTPVGSSTTAGQWGAWRLSEDPESPSTATWSLDFMKRDWQTLHITAAGNLSVVAKPTSRDKLADTYLWSPEGDGFGEGSWDFMLDLMTPVVAYRYDSMNYTMQPVENSFPATYSATPSLKDLENVTLPPSEWQYWSVSDCKDNLVAVMALEMTEGQRPGRTMIYNKDGKKAADVLPDPLVARFQFLDINQRLLATAEAPALGSNIPMHEVPRRSQLGNVLPYTVSFERGGYNLSSDLLREEFRWILGAAIQVRALQDANQTFEPPFLRDRYLLLAVICAVALIVIVIAGAIIAGSLRTAGRIFFHRDKAAGNSPVV